MITGEKGVDPRVRRTRQLLQKALLELSHEKNFASITVQDIAERATVNRATFYAHFEDKYELIASIIREQFQREVASKVPTASDEGINALHVLIGAVFDFLGQVHSQCKPTDTQFEPLFERAVQQELSELMVSWLKQVPASGTTRRVPIEVIGLVMSWAIFGAAVQWSRGARTPTKEQMVDQVLIVLTEGVGNLIPGLLLK